MEFNMNDILAALQSGQDPQNIANSFADQLNAAIRQKAEDDKVASDKKDYKMNRVASVVDGILDLLEDFYPDLYTEEMRDAISTEDLVEAMDEAYAEIQRMTPVLSALDDLLKDLEKEDTSKPTLKVDTKSQVNPIETFLKANGLKM